MFMMKKLMVLFATSALSLGLNAQDHETLTVEELRIGKAEKNMLEVVNRLGPRVVLFAEQLAQARNLTVLTQLVIRHGQAL